MEQQWGDAHARMIVYASDQLQDVLPTGLKSRIEERVFVDSPADEHPRQIIPDLRVVEHVTVTAPHAGAYGGVATLEPLLVEIEDEPTTETFIEIVDTRSGNRVVTVIELLSPANKRPGAGQEPHLRKQNECRSAKVNLVEIDLLRGGERQLVVPELLVPPAYRTEYCACVWRASKPSRGEVYAIGLRGPLPRIAIPLRASDTDVPRTCRCSSGGRQAGQLR